MEHKKILTLLTLTGAVFLILGFFLIQFGKSKKTDNASPLVSENERKEEKEELKIEWSLWQDPAGFSFEYPKDSQLNNHPDDKENYANLELTSSAKKGKITLLCADSKYPAINGWLEKEELVQKSSAIDTKIASQSAKKVVLDSDREIAAFIDGDNVIYTIDVQSEGEKYWQEAYRQILSTFKLTPLEDETEAEFNNWLSSFDTSQADVVESVEVVQ